MAPEPGYANVGVYGGAGGVAGLPGVAGPVGLAGPSGMVAGPSGMVAGPSGMVAGPAQPRWRPLYVQRQDSEQESVYESVGACWWRCRRPGRAQTLEFHSRGPGAAARGAAAGPPGRTHTVPRLRALCGVRVQLDARLSASCAAIDVALPPCAPCVLLLPRRELDCHEYHVLPEAQRRPRDTCGPRDTRDTCDPPDECDERAERDETESDED